MKTSLFRLLAILLALMPIGVVAQTNIQSAFDAIIKCPDAQITERHTLDKDPVTLMKTGQADIYRFVLPAGKAKLIKNVVSAFEKDSQTAYSYSRGKATKNQPPIQLAVGDATASGVNIIEPDCEYIYALFLPSQSEDPDGKYRYAYAVTYKEDDGEITGRLVVTYATTLKYRQQAEMQRQNDVLRNFSNGAYVIQAPAEPWFDTLMSYFQAMSSANSQTRIALASKAYKVIRDTSDYPEVTKADKDAVREILKAMISDKKYSETVLNRLLNQCLTEIK